MVPEERLSQCKGAWPLPVIKREHLASGTRLHARVSEGLAARLRDAAVEA